MFSNKYFLFFIIIGLGACSNKHFDNNPSDLIIPPHSTTTSMVSGKVLNLEELSKAGSFVDKGVVTTKPYPLPSSVVKKKKKAKEVLFFDSKKRYSFNVKDKDIKDALAIFAIENSVNIIPDNDVEGKLTVSFHKVSLNEALKSMLEASGYYWKFDGRLIKVKNIESKIFNIDYPKMIRTGYINNNASLGSSSSGSSSTGTGGNLNSSGGFSSGSGSSGGSYGGGSSGTGSSGNSSSSSTSGVSIGNESNVDFWGSLDSELSKLISKKGKLIINSLAGTINVIDKHRNVVNVEKYLNKIDSSIHRQVVISVLVMDVGNSENKSFGVDWNRITNQLLINTATKISTPLGFVSSPSDSFNLTAGNKVNSISAVISALKEQGDIDIISKPHILTLNNQPAMIKVGTDKTFFRVETNSTNTSAGTNTVTNDVPEKITIGFIMSIVPQISEDGKVILDISPVITSLSGTDTSINGSTAPVLDIKQLSSIVRVSSGETVVVGGLIKNEKGNTKRSVPILGDIPFVGGFFSSKLKIKQSKELVIFITPHVIN